MRITRGQLQDLINEEISAALLEHQNSRLLENIMDPMDTEAEGPMSVDDLMEFARAYSELDIEDRRNLDRILDGRAEILTVEEVQHLIDELGEFHAGLKDYLTDALTDAQADDDDEDDGTWAAAYRANR